MNSAKCISSKGSEDTCSEDVKGKGQSKGRKAKKVKTESLPSKDIRGSRRRPNPDAGSLHRFLSPVNQSEGLRDPSKERSTQPTGRMEKTTLLKKVVPFWVGHSSLV